MICGGANSTIYDNNTETIHTKYKDCYKFQKREWTKMKKGIDKPKFYLGTGNLATKDKFLIHGGLTEDIHEKNFTFADSSEWMGLNTYNSPTRTFPVGGHCNIMISQTQFMVTGGVVPNGDGTFTVTNNTHYCEMDLKKECIAGPHLKLPRRAHGCYRRTISGKQYLYVIGGFFNYRTNRTDVVEYLDMSESESKRQWKLSKFSFC